MGALAAEAVAHLAALRFEPRAPDRETSSD
jgi:hypothetical protein